jgi:hypothetical protein
MKQYEEVFFSVLRTAMWGVPVEIPQGFRDWKYVMKMAKAQALQGLVTDVFLTTPEIVSVLNPKAVERLQDVPLNMMAMHTSLNNTMILILSALRGAGIEPVLLKGQGLSLNYPVPQLRQCGDIDLYVGVDNYMKAYDALLPVVTEIDSRSEAMSGTKHFHAKVGAVYLEVHKYASVLDSSRVNRIYQRYESEGLSKGLVPVSFGEVTVNTPAADFNVYYIFHHLWHHFLTSGIGFRHFCDLALLLHARYGSINLAYLEKVLTDMGEMVPWQVLGCVMVDVLGLPQEEFPFYDASQRGKVDHLLEIIIREGNFGHETAYQRGAGYGFISGKLHSLRFNIRRISNVAKIFPREMASRFFYMLVGGTSRAFKEFFARFA